MSMSFGMRAQGVLFTMLALGVILAAALSWQGFFDTAASALAVLLGSPGGGKTVASSLVLALLVTGFAIILLSWAVNGVSNNANKNNAYNNNYNNNGMGLNMNNNNNNDNNNNNNNNNNN